MKKEEIKKQLETELIPIKEILDKITDKYLPEIITLRYYMHVDQDKHGNVTSSYQLHIESSMDIGIMLK